MQINTCLLIAVWQLKNLPRKLQKINRNSLRMQMLLIKKGLRIVNPINRMKGLQPPLNLVSRHFTSFNRLVNMKCLNFVANSQVNSLHILLQNFKLNHKPNNPTVHPFPLAIRIDDQLLLLRFKNAIKQKKGLEPLLNLVSMYHF